MLGINFSIRSEVVVSAGLSGTAQASGHEEKWYTSVTIYLFRLVLDGKDPQVSIPTISGK